MLTAEKISPERTVAWPSFSQLRRTEFARLDESGAAYLDYAGSALYPASLVHRHHDMLLGTVLGNPHSDSPASRRSTAIIESARDRVLRFFNADPAEYCVVFTANTSAAAHLVAAGFAFEERSSVVLMSDNHNSINGMREYAARAGARPRYVPLDRDLRAVNAEHMLKTARGGAPSLFAFPAQSNFSGVQHPLRLIDVARRRGFTVFLDAAAFAPTHRLDLSLHKPDFAAVSFYKMFGFPTGVGALIARRDALGRLKRPWFAGGTVDFVSVQNNLHRIRDGVEGFEDGTANFASIAAIPAGLDFLDSVGMHRIERHVAAHTRYAINRIFETCADRIVFHGPRTSGERGGTIAFNLLDSSGAVLPYEHIEAAARDANVSIRGGCFCNPGAAEAAFEIPAAPARACMTSAEPFSIQRFRSCLRDKPVGAVRCSLGIATNEADIDRFIAVLRTT